MATAHPDVAKVDYLVDENGAPIRVQPDSAVRATGSPEAAVGATGPASWWRLGLGALAIVALILLIMQVLNGGPARTDVVPGTPTAPPASQPAPTV